MGGCTPQPQTRQLPRVRVPADAPAAAVRPPDPVAHWAIGRRAAAMATEAEVEAMRLALSLASHPANPLGPNPRVGAVILRPEGEVVAEGAHRGRGTPHAEVAALQHVDGDRARGA